VFGPDKCGGNNKVHFIFRHLNPKTGEYEEKHLNNAPEAILNKKSNLYTLIVNTDNTFKILINNEPVRNGSLLNDFTPSVNPPKEIDDVEDKKPADWVDEAKIPDPTASKPEDWDEDAPLEILDLDAKVGLLLIYSISNLTIGSPMNPTPFLILKLPNLMIGMMMKMVNGWPLLFPIQSVLKSLAVENGKDP
jgi:hypothetical protein